jgi:hypothetical protein
VGESDFGEGEAEASDAFALADCPPFVDEDWIGDEVEVEVDILPDEPLMVTLRSCCKRR